MVNLYGLESLGLRGLGVGRTPRAACLPGYAQQLTNPSLQEREREGQGSGCRVEGSGFIVPLK